MFVVLEDVESTGDVRTWCLLSRSPVQNFMSSLEESCPELDVFSRGVLSRTWCLLPRSPIYPEHDVFSWEVLSRTWCLLSRSPVQNLMSSPEESYPEHDVFSWEVLSRTWCLLLRSPVHPSQSTAGIRTWCHLLGEGGVVLCSQWCRMFWVIPVGGCINTNWLYWEGWEDILSSSYHSPRWPSLSACTQVINYAINYANKIPTAKSAVILPVCYCFTVHISIY